MRKDVDPVNLGRQNSRTPDRGKPSGHTPDESMNHRAKAGDLPSDDGSHNEQALTEKARPTETDRGGA